MKQHSELPRKGKARDKQVLSVVPVGRSTLWDSQWRKNTGFPDPEKISPRVTVWDCERVWEWIEARERKAA